MGNPETIDICLSTTVVFIKIRAGSAVCNEISKSAKKKKVLAAAEALAWLKVHDYML